MFYAFVKVINEYYFIPGAGGDWLSPDYFYPDAGNFEETAAGQTRGPPGGLPKRTAPSAHVHKNFDGKISKSRTEKTHVIYL